MLVKKTVLFLSVFFVCQVVQAERPIDQVASLPVPLHVVQHVATPPVYLPDDVDEEVIQPIKPSIDNHKKRQLFVSPSFDYYHVQMPSFRLPVSNGADYTYPVEGDYPSQKSRSFNLNDYHVMPGLRIAYRFPNAAHVLPLLFGNDLTFAMNLSYSHGVSRMNDRPLGTTAIWNLSDDDLPVTETSAFDIEQATVRSSYQLLDLSAVLSGDRALTDTLLFKPRLGLAFLSFKQHYAYDFSGLETDTGSGLTPIWVDGRESIKAYYLGLLVGSRLDVRLMKYWGGFIDGELQGLRAFADFTGDQMVHMGTLGRFPSAAANTQSVLTYRTKVSVGTSYYVSGFDHPDSAKISLLAGIDYWGYMPKVINPNSSNSGGARIAKTTALNHFVRLSFDIPLIW